MNVHVSDARHGQRLTWLTGGRVEAASTLIAIAKRSERDCTSDGSSVRFPVGGGVLRSDDASPTSLGGIVAFRPYHRACSCHPMSAKLTLPLILFIFPCLLGALMLPAIARLMVVFAKH